MKKMTSTRKGLPIFPLLGLICFSIIHPVLLAQTQWEQNGVFFAQPTTSTGFSIHINAASDGHGGAFIVYEDNTSGDADIVAQWIDASGTKRWGASGIRVASPAGNQRFPAITADGQGGAFVSWQDEVFSGDINIVAQRLNTSGTKLWGSSGVTVCSAVGDQTSVKVITDGGSGAILVWADKRNGSTTDLYAQRLNDAGAPQWSANGNALCLAPQNQSKHIVLPDNSGGAFVVWEDYRNGTSNADIYAHRFNGSGAPLWTSNGVAVTSAANNQLTPSAAVSGAKFIVSWEDYRSGTGDIYTQALDFGGAIQWTLDGSVVCTAAGSQTTCRIVEDNAGGAVIGWTDNRSSYDIYAQKINSGGIPQWAANGVAVNASTNYQVYPEMAPDNAGGAVLVWMDSRGSDYDLYSQHISGAGARLWSTDGLPVAVQTQIQQSHVVVPDRSGGILAFWQDSRNARNDVYGQMINDNIEVTAPTSGVLWAGDRSQSIQWSYRTTQHLYHHLEIKASVTPGDGFPVVVASSVAPGLTTQAWTPATVNSATVKVEVRPVNDQGIVVGRYASLVITVDSTPPFDFVPLSPDQGTVTDLRPTFRWRATTDVLSGLDHYELYINSVLVQDNITDTTYALTEAQKLTAGPYTWIVKALDRAGMIRRSFFEFACTASSDITPPNAFHLLSPANASWTASATPLLTWEAATDVGGTLAKYQLWIDGQLAKDNLSATSTSTNAPALSAASHAWYVVAMDQSGNTRQSSETWTVKVDNVSPAAFTLSQPSDNVWTKTAKPTFSWQASSDAGSGLASYQLYVDGLLKLDNIPAGSTSAALGDAQALTEGTHTWAVVAWDAVGNSKASTSAFTIKVDITAPQAFTLTAPANQAYVVQASPTFSWQASSDPVSGIQEYQLWIDGAQNKAGILATSTTPAAGFSEGAHTWTVKAVDKAGNVTTASAFAFTADWTPPNAFALLYPASGSTIHTNTPKFTWRRTSDALSGFNHSELVVDNAVKKGNLAAGDTAVTLTETFSNGNHSWRVNAYDNAGNVRVSADAAFNVQCNPPVIVSALDTSGTEDVAFTYKARATDPDGDPVSITFQNLPAWLSNAGNNTLQGTPREGVTSAFFDVSANDGLFSTTRRVNVAIAAVNDPPDITSPLTVAATEHQAFTYLASATDPDNAVLTFTFKNRPAWLASNKDTLKGIPPEGTSNFTFDLVVSDGSLKDSVRVTVTVTPVNDPPVFTSASQIYATEDVEFAYTAQATDPEGAGITYQFRNQPFWMTVTSISTIRGTATEGILQGGFDVIANDGVKTTTLHVTVHINPVEDPPIITSPDTALAVEHQAFSYTAEGFDPEGKTVNYTFSSYPAWLTPKTGNRIEGTPGEGITEGAFDLTANDGVLSFTKRVRIRVTPVNDSPAIQSPSTASGTEGVMFTYTTQASDPEGQPLTYTFQNVPNWLRTAGQTVSGTPKNGTLTGTFTFTVSDGVLTKSQTVTITIQPVNDAPVITSPSQINATEHIEFTYTAAAYDSEGDPLTYSFQNMSSWLVVSGTTLRGKPEEGITDGSFDIVVSDGQLSSTKHVVIQLTHVNDPPVFTSSNTASGTEDIPFSYTAAATDPENGQVTYGFQNLPTWLAANGSTVSGTPGEKVLSASFDVTASDGVLSSSLHVTVTVTAVNDPPVITSVNQVAATEHQPFKYTPTATDPENDALTFTFKNQSAWLTPNAGFIGGTPGEGVTSGAFDVIVSDGSLSDTLHVTIVVTPVNDIPQFTSSDKASATEDVPFQYEPAATDPEGTAVTFTFSNLSPWLTAYEQTVGGTPGEGVTGGVFDVVASDGSTNATLRVIITVLPVNDPPVVTSKTTDTATEHVPYAYAATATDPDNAVLSFTFQNASPWLKPTGSTIGGTPGEGTTGGAFDVTASDGLLSDTKHVTITVSPVDDPPVFLSKDTVSAVEDEPFSYTAAAQDPENQDVSFAFTALPSWLKASGKEVEGTPLEADHDTSFAVIASDGTLKNTLLVVVKVSQVNDKPRIISQAADTAWENKEYQYKAEVEDKDGGPKQSVRFEGLPDWASAAGGELRGLPPQGATNTSFRIIAWDGLLADTLTVQLVVVAVNDPPRFVLDLPTPVRPAQETLRLDINLDDYVMDPDNAPGELTWTASVVDTSLRVGVSIHPKIHSATIIGFNVSRDVRIVFTVTDPSGSSASDTLTILIQSISGVAGRFSDSVPVDFVLYGGYPNPFNPTASIRYGIPKTARVSVEMYNLSGQRVAVLMDEKQTAGFYEVRWNAAGQPSGVYLCRIRADAWQAFKKITLVK